MTRGENSRIGLGIAFRDFIEAFNKRGNNKRKGNNVLLSFVVESSLQQMPKVDYRLFQRDEFVVDVDINIIIPTISFVICAVYLGASVIFGAPSAPISDRNRDVSVGINSRDTAGICRVQPFPGKIVRELTIIWRIDVGGNGEIVCQGGGESGGIALGSRAERLVTIGDEVGDRDGRQDTDNGDDDHQFDQCETLVVAFSQFAKHVNPPKVN